MDLWAMDGLSRWEILLCLVSAYIAIMSLVRLMIARRNQLMSEVQEQVQDLHGRRKKEARSKKTEVEANKNAA